MLRKFRTDLGYLLRYYSVSTAVLAAITALLVLFPLHNFASGPLLWLALLVPMVLSSVLGLLLAFALVLGAYLYFYSLSVASLCLIPFGIYFGMVAVQLIHNCAHQSFRPRWLNRPLGEILALHLLSGFPGFVILHLTHHQHADHPELDPHPNGELTFWQYFFGIKKQLKDFFRRAYFRQWQNVESAEKSWATTQALLRINRVLRAGVLLLVVGPAGFALFLLPSFVANHLTFAHINYFTHQRQADGSVKILNLEHGIYRWLNVLMLGGYSHRDHHDAPHLFNPARGKIS